MTNQNDQSTSVHDMRELTQGAPTNAMAALARGEVDAAVDTARRYPRSITTFKKRAFDMVNLSEDIAAACIYKIKKGGSSIEGKSVRLAEIVAATYGNLMIGGRIISDDGKFVVAQGIAYDLENNLRYSVEVRRGIRTRDGHRFSDDMVNVTCNAAIAIATRNATFKAVPSAYADIVYAEAKRVAIGNVSTLPERRQRMIGAFALIGVSLPQILIYAEVEGVEDIGLEQLEDLLGAYTAIKDGDQKVDEAFPPIRTEKKDPVGAGEGQPQGQRAAKQAAKGAKGKAAAEAPAGPRKALVDFNVAYEKAAAEWGEEQAKQASGLMDQPSACTDAELVAATAALKGMSGDTAAPEPERIHDAEAPQEGLDLSRRKPE